MELHHGTAALRPALSGRTAHFLAGERVEDEQLVGRPARPAQLDRDALVAPRRQAVVRLAGLPLVEAFAAGVEGAGPVPLGGVAGAGEAEHVAGRLAGAEGAGERLVDGAAA